MNDIKNSLVTSFFFPRQTRLHDLSSLMVIHKCRLCYVCEGVDDESVSGFPIVHPRPLF